MAPTCPPPPSTLGPPPVPTIDAFGGVWKVAFPIFQKQAKFEVAGRADSDLHYEVTVPVAIPLMNLAGPHPLRDKLQQRVLVNPLVKGALDAAVKKSKELWKRFLDTPTAWQKRQPRVGPDLSPPPPQIVTDPPPLSERSRWTPIYGNRDRSIRDILRDDQWRLVIGVARVAVLPREQKIMGLTRSESAKAFTARGGYLLHRDTLIAAPGKRIPVETIQPSWVPKHDETIEKFQVYTLYNVGAGQMTLVMAMRNPTGWQRTWDHVVGAAAWTCSKITNDKVATAAAFAGTAAGSTGVGATVVAGWAAAASLCGMAFPKCVPGIGTGGAGAGGAGGAGGLPPEPTYPPGTIAWFDPKLVQYRIATPMTLGGLQPTHQEVAVADTVPTNVAIVGRFKWEDATRPWYRRTWVIGTGIGLAVAGAGTTAALVLRNRR